MANYYEVFSAVVEAPTEALDWLAEEIEALNQNEFICDITRRPSEEEDPHMAAHMFELRRVKENDCMILYCAEGPTDVSRLCNLVAEMQTKFKVNIPFGISVSYTCDHPRVDEHGGYSNVVHKGVVHDGPCSLNWMKVLREELAGKELMRVPKDAQVKKLKKKESIWNSRLEGVWDALQDGEYTPSEFPKVKKAVLRAVKNFKSTRVGPVPAEVILQFNCANSTTDMQKAMSALYDWADANLVFIAECKEESRNQ